MLYEPLKNYGPLPTRRRAKLKPRSQAQSSGPVEAANTVGGDGTPGDDPVQEAPNETVTQVETPVAASEARRAELTTTDTTTDTGPLPSPSDFAKGTSANFGFTGVWRIDKYGRLLFEVCAWIVC